MELEPANIMRKVAFLSSDIGIESDRNDAMEDIKTHTTDLRLFECEDFGT